MTTIISKRLFALIPKEGVSFIFPEKMSFNVDLRSYRRPYHEDEDALLEENLPTKNPFELFAIWFEEAKNSGKSLEPNAVCLSTSTKSGIPSSRMVLLKSFGSDGFKIFTNLSSRKGRELAENPNAALLFYWDFFNKQVRIEGKVHFLTEEESTEYFHLRPKTSQLAAAVSNQSQVISSREGLIAKYQRLDEEYANEEHVPKPIEWGGLCLIPLRWEFWQGQTSRLHDRICFYRSENSEWILERLQP